MEKGKNNKIYIFILGLLILSALLFLFSLYLDSKKVLEHREILTKLTIGDTTGFDVSKDALNFGKITEGSIAYREDLVIENNYNFPVEVNFDVKGNISDYLVYDKKVYFEPGESKNILFATIDPVNEPYETYSGKIVIEFRRQ